MKILYVVSSPELNVNANTGYSRHINECVNELIRQGHEVSLFSTGSWKGLSTITNGGQPSVVKKWIKRLVPAYFWASVRDARMFVSQAGYRRRLVEVIRSFDPDIIYERDSYLVHFIPIMRSSSSPWYVEVNAPIIEEREKMSGRSIMFRYAMKAERKKLHLSEGVFCVSEVLADRLSKDYELDNSRLHVNPNGVDHKRFVPGRPFELESFTFGFVGSIMPYHGIDDLISCFKKVNGLFPNTNLMIVGDGAELPQLKLLTIELGLSEDSVHFVGSIPALDVPDYIERMKICIMPRSNWYGSPVKIFEYGAMAKPVIGPNVGPVKEIIQNDVNGKLVRNQEELISAMIELHTDEEFAKTLGLRLRRDIVAKYTWQANVDRILKTVDQGLIRRDDDTL